MLKNRISVLVAGFALLTTSQLLGQAQQQQKFKELSVWSELIGNDSTTRNLYRKVESQVMAVLRGQVPLDGSYQIPNKAKNTVTNQQLLGAWLNANLLPRMTQVANLGNLSDERQALFGGRFIMQARSAAAHDFAIEAIYTTMSGIVTSEEYHPAVRYNAILTIGLLNQQESGSFQPPTPLPKATTFLFQQYQAAKSDAIKLGALVGILRHVKLDRVGKFLPQQQKGQALSLAMALLNQQTPPAGRDLSGHTWFQRRAIDVLAALGTPQGGVLEKLASIIADNKAPLSLRLTAAQSLGHLNYDQPVKINVVQTAQDLGQLAVLSCRQEAARVEDRTKKEAIAEARTQAATQSGFGQDIGGDPAAMGGGDSTAEMAQMFEGGDDATGGKKLVELLQPADRRKVYHTTQRIRAQLFAVYQGLGSTKTDTGLMKIANQAEQQQLQRISDSLVNIVRAMDGKPDPKEKDPKPITAELNLEQVLKAVSTKVLALENGLPKPAVPQPQSQPKQPATPQPKKTVDASQIFKGG